MKIINENTALSIGLVVIIAGGIVYITNLAFKIDALAASMTEISEKQKAIDAIQTDIAVIKFKVEQIDKKIGD